jgi:hypothetical protein
MESASHFDSKAQFHFIPQTMMKKSKGEQDIDRSVGPGRRKLGGILIPKAV